MWFNIFTLLLCIGGILLTTYTTICIRKQKNILAKLPNFFQYTCRIVVTAFIISFTIIETLIVVYGVHKDEIKPDYILVLGAAVQDDKPSEALQFRLDVAYEQYLKHPTTTIICSGGKAKDTKYSEAEVMEKYLLALGVPKKQIQIEDQSFSTYENLYNSYHLVKNKKATFLIITNNFHALRAHIIAERLGMNAYSYPSQKLMGSFGANYIREYIALIKTLVLD